MRKIKRKVIFVNITDLSGSELVLLASIFAIAFSRNVPEDELDVWGNFFSAFGSNLSIIAGVDPN